MVLHSGSPDENHHDGFFQHVFHTAHVVSNPRLISNTSFSIP